MKLENLSKESFNETVERFEKQRIIKSENELAGQSLKKLKYVQPNQVMQVMEYQNISNTEIFNDIHALERTIGGTDDLMPINYFLKAIKSGKSVARVTLFSGSGQELGHGTGFMITNNLFMTNNHVFETSALANNSLVEFNYEVDENKTPKSSVIFRADTFKFFYTNKNLDFTIVAIEENSIDNAHKIFEFGFLPMVQQTGKIAVGGAVSIIQHPNGNRKSVALRNNKVTLIEGNFIQYETDTQPGSSGSPVFNDAWELVGIHHSGVPKMDSSGNWLTRTGTIATNATPEEDIDWIANEGVRISSIISDLKTNVTPQQRILLNEVFANNPDTESPVIPVITSSVNNSYYDAVSDKTNRDTYYQGIDLTTSNLFDSFSTLISQTHKNILSYSPSKFLYPEIDVHPDGKLRSIYSNKEYSPQEFIRLDEEINAQRKLKLTELAQNNGLMLLEDFQNEIDAMEAQMPYNCEHVVPQSWFRKQNPMRGDLHHLFACESGCNSFRSNIPYFDFPNYNPDELTDADEVIRQMCGNREVDKFEPQANKAIVARATLYFLLRYPKNISNNYDEQRVNTLKNWHLSASPNDYEKHRNALIFKKQGNRNPLIDFPELVNKIDFRKGM